MHPATIHDNALFTIDQVTKKFKLDTIERRHLEKQLNGKEAKQATYRKDQLGAFWYRWVTIQRVLTELGVLV